MTDDVLTTERVGGVMVATMNRPHARNALNTALREALSRTLRAADADPEVRVLVLTGAGPVFCAGMDLKEFAERGGGASGQLVWFYRDGITKPVIAALNGSALAGGFELMLACDLVVAADTAKLGIPEVRRGLFAAGGGTTLPARVPMAVALEMGLTGDPVTAARACELGLVNLVVPADRLLDQALALAQRIAANAPLSVTVTKKLMRERRWGDPAEVEAVFRSADALEGARAFAERRPPAWSGR